MRLKEKQIKHICHGILAVLRARKLISLKKSEQEALTRMESIFMAELRVEDEINRDAQALVEKHADQMDDKIDREKMFQLFKKQLVKDRKVIL